MGRDGHTATFLPDTGEIIYIGGINKGYGLIDIANMTVNPPEPRYGHTAVLSKRDFFYIYSMKLRIVIFGGAHFIIEQPVKTPYVVLDTKTFEWYIGPGDLLTRAPFRHHTATLYNDYMFISFGKYIFF
ncbi:hypothetical protein C1645_739755 [Glomus cerebriforme]|uniref:Kelch repeat protein n=1 Tax=Glomus cerebriforme TaxID=658196 RepID=A0A397STL4_9GLOM|nr:hypothetical protein C1645_739755 [Glomus cerebriforme]